MNDGRNVIAWTAVIGAVLLVGWLVVQALVWLTEQNMALGGLVAIGIGAIACLALAEVDR